MRNLSNFGGRFRPTESLWGIVSKICWANKLSRQTLSRFLDCSFTGSLFVNFDVAAFATATGIDEAVLKEAMGYGLFDVEAHELRDLAYQDLRYCPTCMSESGFHSILFQFPFTSHCPVHPTEKLVGGCRCCNRPVPYRIPVSTPHIYACAYCGDQLWKPAQRPPGAYPGDDQLKELRAWVGQWLRSVHLYAGSAAPLQHWVEHSEADKWARKGVPELDGVFTVRALRGAIEAGYWGGRTRVTAGRNQPDPSGTYLRVLDEVSAYADLNAEGFGDWVHRFHSKAPVSDRRRWAFAGWRVFWEGLQTASELTGEGYLNRGELAGACFRDCYRKLLVPAGFGPQAPQVNDLIFREVLRATYAVAADRVVAGGQPTFAELAEAIRTAPAPVFMARPAPDGALVEWVHQIEVSKTGLEIFGNSLN